MQMVHKMFPNYFIPHGHCYLWKPGLMGLHILSDALIAVAYFLIPITLIYIVKKRKDVPLTGFSCCLALLLSAAALPILWKYGRCGILIIGSQVF